MAVEPLYGPLPSDWTVTTLGAACAQGGGDIQTGPFGSQLHAADYVASGIPSIMPQNIGDNRVNTDGIARVASRDVERLSRYRVRQGDIVYSRRGDVERRALIRAEEDGWLCGTGCLRVRLGQGYVDPLYCSYYLGHPAVRQWIVRHAVGATMPNLNTSILSALPIAFPDLTEQRAIAAILGALDDKIELNRRMNATLEEMARALFQAWFVDFEPVRAKMEGRRPVGMDEETAALFPDAFENSVLGEIPQGWVVGSLEDISTNPRRGVIPTGIASRTPYIGLEHMPRKSVALDSWGYADEVESNKFQYRQGEILFGKLRPYFHKVGVAVQDGVCSTDILVVAPVSKDWFAVLLFHISSDRLIARMSNNATGTKMPRASWHDIADYQVALPSTPALANALNAIVGPMVDEIRANVLQSSALAITRDTLLPTLLSGETHVRDRDVQRLVEQQL